MSFETFIDRYPIKLTEQQRSAVKAVDGPVLLLAVPGSGKTTVLITRLGYMVYELNIPPERILTVTYTVAATADMKNRFCAFFGDEYSNRMVFSTINSMSLEVIRCYERFLGRSAFKTQGDEKVILGLIRSLYIRHVGNYPTDGDIKDIRTKITYTKNMLLTKKEIEALDTKELPFSEIYDKYCGVMTENRWMDFDDQMVYAYRILLRHREILSYFQDRFTYVCVDEAQDTSKLQHSLIALLASRERNLFMVGDEDQSIYGFRAAYPEALTEFEKQYENARVLYMEDNFRSVENIVEKADAFIQKNTLRHKKQMRATKGRGCDVKELHFTSRQNQYNYFLKMAMDCRLETAFLYKNNEDVIPLVNLFEKNKVSYRIKGSDYSFFTKRAVTDVKSVIQFANDPSNVELFMQIYYKIKTYLKKEEAERACAFSKRYRLPILDAVLEYGDQPAYVNKAIASMITHLNNMLSERADRAVYRIVNYMGYREYLEKMQMSDNPVKILEAVGIGEPSPLALLERLEHISELLKNGESREGGKGQPVILSTIHSSKGLEYDRVVLFDVIDGILPEEPYSYSSRMTKEERSIYEEERRLFYVGMTRAKSNLFIASYDDCESVFTSEVFNEKNAQKAVSYSFGANSADSAENDEFLKKCVPGTMVYHRLFGEGIIACKEGDILTIIFKSSDPKDFSAAALSEGRLIRFI